MDKKYSILIVIVFILLCIGSYLIFDEGKNITYHRVNLTNSCSAMVPESANVSTYNDNLGIQYYCDYDFGFNITSFNTANNVTSAQGTVKMERLRLDVTGDKIINESGVRVYRNDDLNNYVAYVDDKTSHNQILICSSDLTILIKIYQSLEASILVDDDGTVNSSSSSYSSGSSGSSGSSSYSSGSSSYSSGSSGSSSYSSGSTYSDSGSYSSNSSN